MANFFLRQSWRKEWGKTICYLLSLLGLVALIPRGPGGHYRIFVESYRAFASGLDPYAAWCTGCTAPFLYSPSASLYFYSLFSFLPAKLGEVSYTLLSTGLFLFTLNRFLETLEAELDFAFSKSPFRHLAWLMVASELMGGILATKPEILLVTGALAATRALWLGHYGWAGLLLAAVCNFKLQGLPLVGLMAVPAFWHRRAGRAFVSFAVFSSLLYLAPWLYLGSWQKFQAITASWLHAVDQQVSTEWLKAVYQHLFGFLHAANWVPMSLPLAKKILTGVGGLLALGLSGFCWREPRTPLAFRRGVLLALGLGCLYIVAFSPLSQSNGYLWYVP